MTRFLSEALGKRDRAAFASGNDRIDAYFRTAVSQDVKRNYAACYVLVEQDSARLAGFYTLSATHIPLPDIPPDIARKLPRYPNVPAVLIGWLGRDLGFRGENIGGLLLHDAIARVSASHIGASALFADAIDEAAAEFYRRHQFIALVNRPGSLFLPWATAIKNLPTPSTGATA
ncbi:GNAT family N-acetyltransferase [Lichenifustis flavocetrariae]|uniref:GNAT family N-acetyltransferase n=1 Tax=Lichenifustis flavocetrariae TaxID=2949735 RepID=A0AA41Z2E2_9HYPH|nr:GNAT family N-acetyltransferase [Lichenifustis flavocetrariae]MCW6512966.1 GNAT family N-acetyltransferase [Lichenifustis flavocetrariae]